MAAPVETAHLRGSGANHERRAVAARSAFSRPITLPPRVAKKHHDDEIGLAPGFRLAANHYLS